MEKYDVTIIVAGLVTTALTISAPVLKLNTAITQLIVKLDILGEDMDDLEVHNRESHRRIHEKNDEQDGKLADHEGRIRVLENEKERN